ncbi:MAG: quinol:electron acceptor oxidoreductase subunit ActD [Planctomycetaceae bacterium]
MAATAPSPELDADVADHQDVVFEPRLAGVVAEFDSPKTLMAAAEVVRDAGYVRWDTHTPYPIHGMDEAMGIRRTVLPWIVLAGGLTGVTVAILLQYWTNASAWAENIVGWPFSGYQYPISGKPYWSLPANIPIAFELTVLFSAFAGFLGMIALNRLHRFYNPMFKLEQFRRVTDDRFFLAIDANDAKFNARELPAYLRGLGAITVDECWDDEPRRIPSGFATAGLVIFAFALVPPVLVMRHRSTTFTVPEFHPVQDMDFQHKFKSQQRNVFFADDRAMRPQVDGTIARGQFAGDERYYFGIEPGQAMASLLQEPEGDAEPPAGDEAASDAAPNGQPAPPAAGMNENQNWTATLPPQIEITEEVMLRGQEQFNIYCAPCHGIGGYGDGLVNMRALDLKASTWIPVPSLHAPQTRNRKDGYIFRAITEGVRKMPAYGSQIEPQDRWAIVLYVRALQKSQGWKLEKAEKP